MSASEANGTLTKAQQERIEKNRQRALTIRKSRLVSHPYAKGEVATFTKSSVKIGSAKYKDTGGGFLLEEFEDEDFPVVPTQPEAPVLEEDRPSCKLCNSTFANSWLFDSFDLKVCDKCKDPEIHKLITKTEAIKEYLLKECDFEKRQPPLRFIQRKNPNNVRWGDMKLYLQVQVEERALEVWGSKEKIEEHMEEREEKRIMAKAKKYQKQMKELRMNMRSSLYDKTTAAAHTHEFGSETYNEEDDTYQHTCTVCKYEETFEKM